MSAAGLIARAPEQFGQSETNTFITEPEWPGTEAYWLGTIAHGDVSLGDPRLLQAAQRLRARTYIDELQWLPETSRDARGCESDALDAQSLHVAMIDNLASDNEPQVFANVRFIRADEEPLPVEEEFGVSLARDGSPLFEVSRLMSRHADKRVQTMGSIALVCSTVRTLNHYDAIGYATIERKLFRRVTNMGLAVELITEPKALEEYGNTVNYGVKIDGQASLAGALAMGRTLANFPYGRFFDIAVHGTEQELVSEIQTHLGLVGSQERVVS